jgi:energy-coupling factor transporter transmembrane protein EcfT
VLRVGRSEGFGGANGLAGLATCLATLICVYHQVYDVLLLVVPFTAVVIGRGEPWRSMRPAVRLALVVLVAVPFCNIFWTDRFLGIVTGVPAAAFLSSPGPDSLPWRIVYSANGACLVTALVMALVMTVSARRLDPSASSDSNARGHGAAK